MTVLPQGSQDAEAVQLRQHEVEDHQIGIDPGESLQAGSPVFRRLDLVAFDLQIVSQAEGEIAIVLNHQDAIHGEPPVCSVRTTSSAAVSGSPTTNLAPPRSPDVTQQRPPWRPTRSFTTDRPIPVPATADCRSRSSL